MTGKRVSNITSAVILSVTLVAAVVTLSVTDAKAHTNTVIIMLGFISTLIMTAINTSKTSEANDKVNDVDQKITNGLIPNKVVEGLTKDEAKQAIRAAIIETESERR